MTLNGLPPVFARDPQLWRQLTERRTWRSPIEVIGPRALSPMLMALLAEPPTATGRCWLVTATTREAEDLAAELRGFLAADAVVEFPCLGNPSARTVEPQPTQWAPTPKSCDASHIRTTDGPARGQIKVVVAGSSRCCNRSSPASGLGAGQCAGGRKSGAEAVVEQLVPIGYGRTDPVTRRESWRYAAALWTSSLPTDDHPLPASNSSAMRSRRSGLSVTDQRSRWTWWSADCGRHRVVKCC